MNNELHENTRKLLRQLNYFIVHVVLYFFVNMGLVLAAFDNIDGRWWIFFIVIGWALALIFHGLKVYGVNILNPKDKRANLIWSWLMKFAAS